MEECWGRTASFTSSLTARPCRTKLAYLTLYHSGHLPHHWCWVFKYYGGVLGPNGLIYFVPRIAKNIGIFDPASSSFTTLALSHIISILYYS